MTLPNTVFLRLDGPLQAWGVTSRFVVRDTADVPSKSGVLGLVCAAMGLRREQANGRLAKLAALRMGVRLDRPGTKFTDYHTAGAKVGMMTAAGKIKETATTGEIETHVMRKEYLADAAFLVALQGDAGTVKAVADALDDPKWPPFLGRKSCPPSVPVYDPKLEPHGEITDLKSALESIPWRPRLHGFDAKPNALRAVIEAVPVDGRTPPDARPVQDVPVSFTHRVYGTRWVRDVTLSGVTTDTAEFTGPPRRHGRPATSYPGWREERKPARHEFDHWRCVFCKVALPKKSQFTHAHHVRYDRVGYEPIEDLRSLCQVCHDAITLLEYAAGMAGERIDPCDPRYREAILAQRTSILTHRDQPRRKRALRTDEEDE